MASVLNVIPPPCYPSLRTTLILISASPRPHNVIWTTSALYIPQYETQSHPSPSMNKINHTAVARSTSTLHSLLQAQKAPKYAPAWQQNAPKWPLFHLYIQIKETPLLFIQICQNGIQSGDKWAAARVSRVLNGVSLPLCSWREGGNTYIWVRMWHIEMKNQCQNESVGMKMRRRWRRKRTPGSKTWKETSSSGQNHTILFPSSKHSACKKKAFHF